MANPDEAVKAAALQAQSGRLDLAVPALQAVLRQDANHVEANRLLGIAFLSARQPQQGMMHIERAIASAPTRADLYHLKGEASAWMGNIRGAIEALEKSVELNPNVAQTHALLATCLLEVKDLDGAEEEYLAAIRIQPNHAEARTNYATILTSTARPVQAVQVLRETARDHPQHLGVLTNYCVAVNYAEGVTPEEIIGAHRHYGQVLMGQPAPGAAPMDARSFANPRDPGRRLKIGLVSPDLFDHSVAYFVRPMLEHRDRARFDYTVYATGPKVDAMTRRVQGAADAWREMAGSTDARLIETIRADKIDILIELSGQTHGNRLAALRLRGAPVQVTYIGYPNTTGVPAMDYRIVDSLTDPPGAEAMAVEKLIRLDPCFLCYTPREDAPPLSEPPSERNGHITYGSFNSLKKLTPSTIALWCRLVRETPGGRARLVIKSGTAFAESAKENLDKQLRAQGLREDQFDLLERMDAKTDRKSVV